MYLNQIVKSICDEATKADIDVKELRQTILRNYKCKKSGRKRVFTIHQAKVIIRNFVSYYSKEEYSFRQMLDLAQRESPGIPYHFTADFLREKAMPHKTGGGLFHIPKYDVNKYIAELGKAYEKRKNTVSLRAAVKQVCPTNIPNAMMHVIGELEGELEKHKKNGKYLLPKKGPLLKRIQGVVREYKRKTKPKKRGTGPKKISKLPNGALIVKEAVLYLQKDKKLFYVNRDEHLQRFTHFREGDEFDYVLKIDIDHEHKRGGFRFVPFFIISEVMGGNYKVREMQEKEKLPERMVLLRDSQRHETPEEDGGFLLGDVRIALDGQQEKLNELETLVKQYEKNYMPRN